MTNFISFRSAVSSRGTGHGSLIAKRPSEGTSAKSFVGAAVAARPIAYEENLKQRAYDNVHYVPVRAA
ncbi:MAG: hypothetical protein ACR2HX_14630 [Pyrinomonadaceae bacterium]